MYEGFFLFIYFFLIIRNAVARRYCPPPAADATPDCANAPQLEQMMGLESSRPVQMATGKAHRGLHLLLLANNADMSAICISMITLFIVVFCIRIHSLALFVLPLIGLVSFKAVQHHLPALSRTFLPARFRFVGRVYIYTYTG